MLQNRTHKILKAEKSSHFFSHLKDIIFPYPTVRFHFIFQCLNHRVEDVLSSLECLIVKIKDSLFLTFRIKISAHESLQSMNVHLIVNQIKVEEKEEANFDED